MSVCGDSTFIVEGEKGQELYDKIMAAVGQCAEFSDSTRDFLI